MPSVASGKTGKQLNPKQLHENLGLLLWAAEGPEFNRQLEGYGLYQGPFEVGNLWENLEPEFALKVFRQKNQDLDLSQLRNVESLSPDQVREFALGVVRSLLNV